MRRCCCCISVHAGSVILGIVAVVLAGLELAVLIPYLLGLEDFNPIGDNMDQAKKIIEESLKDQNGIGLNETMTAEIMRIFGDYTYTALLTETILACIYALFAILMIAGVRSRVRCLMVPYLVYQMIAFIIAVLAGIAITVGLFFVSAIMGGIATGIVLIASFLFLYFWLAVQTAFVEIGNRDYMYSPAPVKPIYNPPGGGGNSWQQPNAPQHFQME